jgi:anti-sigma B factor antagonist
VGSSDLVSVRVDTRGDAVLVSVSGELDLATVPVLRERLHSLDEIMSGSARLVIDLSSVTFIGSAGLALLVEVRQRCAERDASLAVVATGGVVPRAIQVTALDQILSIYPTVDDALGGGES